MEDLSILSSPTTMFSSPSADGGAEGKAGQYVIIPAEAWESMCRRLDKLESEVQELKKDKSDKLRQKVQKYFSTNIATCVFKQAREGGFLDAERQPINLSGAEKAILARHMWKCMTLRKDTDLFKMLNKSEKKDIQWALFECLWNMSNLRTYKNKPEDGEKYSKFTEKVKENISVAKSLKNK